MEAGTSVSSAVNNAGNATTLYAWVGIIPTYITIIKQLILSKAARGWVEQCETHHN